MKILLDSDKTLTYKDTVLGFYYLVAKRTSYLRLFYFIFYIPLSVLHKLNIITNYQLKYFGVIFFLRGISLNDLNVYADEYCR